MTGRPYPPPQPTSPFDPWTTIISQYANSPILDAMILAFNAAEDQTANIDNFYSMIWNINTAQGYGLDVWGRIVGVSRTVSVPIVGTFYFGFGEAGGSWQSFTGSVGGVGGTFYSGGTLTQNISLSDTDFRRLILAKAAGNISNGSIQTLNSILLALFPGRGDAFVIDGLNMTIIYRLKFTLSITDQAILAQSGVLPKPAGVAFTIQSGPDIPSIETNPHWLGRFTATTHNIPPRLRMPQSSFDVVVDQSIPSMPLRPATGWIQVTRPRYMYGVGGSVADGGSTSVNFIIPGWKSW